MEYIIIGLLLVLIVEVTYGLVGKRLPVFGTRTATPVFVDTSVLIDGRIVAIASSGFIGRPLLIPRSVVGELQYLADNADHDKRARARYGLDVINELQQLSQADVSLYQDGSVAKEGVDERLLKLAKKHSGAVCTIDYNLNKVAVVEGVEVLNINELAKQLRMAHLPGERLMLALTQKGQDTHQAVGHLDDGTMVVVEQAARSIGNTVEIELIRSLQTAAGKMLFAKLVQPKRSTSTAKTPTSRAPAPKKRTVVATEKPAKPAAPKPSRTERLAQKKSQTTSRRKTNEDSLIELLNQQD